MTKRPKTMEFEAPSVRRLPGPKIVLATDLLPKSEAALDRAGMLAEQRTADLSLLHVVMPSASERALEQHLKAAIAQVRSRARPPLWKYACAPNVIVKVGSPASRIIETVEELGAELVIVGLHRRRALNDALRGTVAGSVLASRTAPVLIVNQNPQGAYRNVVVAVDMSKTSGLALSAAESLVIAEDASPVVVHGYETPHEGALSTAYGGPHEDMFQANRRRWDRESEAAVRGLLERHTSDPNRYSVVLEHMRPAPAILSAVRRLQPDLLVMGTRGHGRFQRALLGSVARQVLSAATCDLLIVPDQVTRRARAGTRRSRAGTQAPQRSLPHRGL